MSTSPIFNPAVSLTLAAYDSFNNTCRNKSAERVDSAGKQGIASQRTSSCNGHGPVIAGAFVYSALPVLALIETVVRCALAMPIILISLIADCFDLIDKHDRNHWFNKYLADPLLGGLYFGEMALIALWTALYFNFKHDEMPNSRELMDEICPCNFDGNLAGELLDHYAPASP